MTLVYNDIKTLKNILFAQLYKLISSQLICYTVDVNHLFHILGKIWCWPWPYCMTLTSNDRNRIIIELGM